MRVLVLSNMLPDALHPERGSFVRDQVAALRSLGRLGRHGRLELEVELYEFAPGARALSRAPLALRGRFGGGERFDVVHAHFGLTAWPALAVPAHARGLTVHGTDISHPRTRLATRAVLPSIDLLAAVSAPLARQVPGRAARGRVQVLPCGVDVERFHPLARAEARAQLGLEPERPYLLFAADPARAEKRHDRALALAGAVDVELLSLGGVDPELVPLWINAANAVLVPSDREGFGLAALEALACDVPVLATPVGIHLQALAGIDGVLCAPFELTRWRAALEPQISASDPRVLGRASAMRYSATSMAERVAAAWSAVRERSG